MISENSDLKLVDMAHWIVSVEKYWAMQYCLVLNFAI